MKRENVGRYISLLLRHKPGAGGITLDEHGYADVDDLLRALSEKYQKEVDRDALFEIVANDSKRRYALNEDKTKIRANQGHSVNVDVGLTETLPPEYLFHGSARKYERSIATEGILPKSRLYVHLSGNIADAKKVGKRHGEPVVYAICTNEMILAGYRFYLAANDVWLVKCVPPKYIRKVKEI